MRVLALRRGDWGGVPYNGDPWRGQTSALLVEVKAGLADDDAAPARQERSRQTDFQPAQKKIVIITKIERYSRSSRSSD